MMHTKKGMETMRRTGTDRKRGQALAEMGIVVLLLLTMLFGIIEFGRMFMLTNMVVHAARDGARVGAVLPQAQSATVTAHVSQLLDTIAPGLQSQVTYATDGSGVQLITVTITGDIEYMFKFPLWGEGLEINRSVTFRHEAAT